MHTSVAVATWDDQSRELIDWYLNHRHELPAEPFDLCPWARVVDPHQFYRWLDKRHRVQSGRCPRASWSLA